MVTVMKQRHFYILLEDHHNIRPAKKEVAHFLALFYVVANLQHGKPVAEANLGHAHGHHGHQVGFLVGEVDQLLDVRQAPIDLAIWYTLP